MIIYGGKRQCRTCGDFYVLTANKPGYVWECGPCGRESEVPLVAVSPEVLAVTDFGDFEFAERAEVER